MDTPPFCFTLTNHISCCFSAFGLLKFLILAKTEDFCLIL